MKEKGPILVLIRNALWLGKEMVPQRGQSAVLMVPPLAAQLRGPLVSPIPALTIQVAARKSQSFADHVAAVNGGGVSRAYRNKMACAEMQSCLASVIRKWRLQRVARSAAFGVMIDEGTDIGWEHCLIVYLKFVDAETGKVETCFHALLELDGKDAATIFDALLEEITQVSGLPISKWASTGYDGASVNVGGHSGVGVRLGEHQPYMVRHHDLAHKEQLVASNADDTTKVERRP